jgi:antitoxin HicB
MRYSYPTEIDEAPDGITVTFPDVPEAITVAATRDAAMALAQDALVTALSFYADENRPMPAPTPARGRVMVAVPVLEAAKLALHDAMLAGGISNLEMARRLGRDEKAIRRLRDPLHASKIDQVEAALRLLGKRIELSVTAVA